MPNKIVHAKQDCAIGFGLKKKSRDLFAMIRQLGKPMWFC